jgi:hypothetical protein
MFGFIIEISKFNLIVLSGYMTEYATRISIVEK